MMMPQGVTKRGVKASSEPMTLPNHHAEVHSILKNRHIRVHAISPASDAIRERGISLPRRRSKSRSKTRKKSKSNKQRSHSQPAQCRTSEVNVPSLQDSEVGGFHIDERGSRNSDKIDLAKSRSSRGRQGSTNSEVSRGRDAGTRKQSESSTRGASLNRYPNILRGRNANNDSIAYDDEIVIRAESFGSSQQSSLTADERRKPRSKSLIRSAIKHLRMSSKKRHDQVTRDHENYTQGTGSTITASEESSPVQWDPQSSLVISGKQQLEIIDSDSDEDQSCATRSDKGPNDSSTKLNTEGIDTLDYGEVFRSSEHHLFRNTMEYDEEGGDLSNSSTTKESKPNRWISIRKAVGRSRSVSVRRRKCKSDNVAKDKQKEERPSTVKNKSVQQQIISKGSKLRSASVDTKKAIMKVNIGRSFSVSRISPKKAEISPPSTMPQKKVKCIVCRQRLSRGHCIEHMGLYFCAGLDGPSCFQCAKCRCSLDHLTSEDARVNNAQVITNSRGSVVQCGQCSTASFTEPKQKKVCAICYRDFSSYNGEIQVLGEQTYHSACLKRKSIKLTGQSADLHLETTDEPTPGDSAQCLPQKCCVKLSIQDGSMRKREYLAAIFFEWEDKQNDMAKIRENEHSTKMEKFLMNDNSSPVDLSLEIAYSLDPFAFGNPNYSGHLSSALGASHKYSPRKTSVTFPVNVEIDNGGKICTDFVAELQWIGLQNPANLEHVSSELTIQPYPYEDSSTVRKCMNQLWRHKYRGIIHEFQFSVPFKSQSLTMEINEADELDLTNSRFDVYLDIDPTQQQSQIMQDDHMAYNDNRITIPNVPDWESRADELMHEIDTYDFRAKPSRVASKSLPPNRRKRGANSVHQEQDHVRTLDPDGEEIANFAELLSVARSSGDHHAISLPKVVHINAYKKSDNEDTGLCLIETNGSSLVAEVSKHGIFSKKLTEGAVILAINGKPVRNPRHFMRLFRDAESKLTIMASEDPPIPGCSFIVVRKEKDTLPDLQLLKTHPNDTLDTLGMSFEIDPSGLVRVREIDPDGLFATSRIASGDICLMVDGVPATTLHSAVRSLAFARGAVSLLTFPLSKLWRNLLDLTIREEYSINWRGSTTCELTAHNKEHPIRIHFDSVSGLCFEETGTCESIQSDLSQMNTIVERTMDMLIQSIKIYREPPDARGSVESTTRSRSVSVSASGSLRGRSDVYRRALIKLEEMMASGKLSKQDYKEANQALMLVAIH